MALSPGGRIGPYEIVRLAGAGGMGEVYEARDTRLDRTVAIKVLATDFANRSELRERLEREARAISSLTHPNICTLFDIGEHEGASFLVMEYLEGEMLDARLARGPIPLEQAVRWAIDIANALAAAHRTGITHRDLKPGNIMLTRTGPKLLDFGLAKEGSAALNFSGQTAVPTRVSLTAQGTIVGTLQYMAPEQIEGANVDARTDIFAFGATLYEMVTGRKAFDGKSQASVLAAILGSDPPLMSTLRVLTPAALDQLVVRCLAKDPGARWQSMADVAHALHWILDVKPIAATAVVSSSSRRVQRALIGTTAAFAIGAAAVSFVHFSETPVPAPVLRYAIPLPKEGQSEGLFFHSHLSPDGRYVAVTGVLGDASAGIFVRPIDGWNFRRLPGTTTQDFFWSPDSRSIAFFDDRQLKKINVSGGPPEVVCDLDTDFGNFGNRQAAGSWSRNGVIAYSIGTGPLFQVAATGGTPRPLTSAPSGASHLYPAFLSDGRHFLYTARGIPAAGIYVASVDGAAGARLLADQSSVRFAASGRDAIASLIFVRDGKL